MGKFSPDNMSQIRKEIGFSPEEIYRKLDEEYGSSSYRVLNKGKKRKWFRKQYIFEFELIQDQKKKDRKTIIDILKESKNERVSSLKNEETLTRIEQIKPETEKVLSSEFSEVWDYLKEQEVDSRWIEHLLETAQKENPKTLEEWKQNVNRVVEQEMTDWAEKNDYQILTLFGPTGVGKTTTLIKIMNRLQKGAKKIGVITTDNFRVGAYEQMKNYSEKLDFPLIQSNIDELKIPVNVFKHQKGMDYILIDTYGRNPKDTEMKEEIEMYLKTVNPESVSLVLAANQKYKDMVKTIRAYDGVSIDHLIITKMDETDSYGFIYNLYKEFNIPISYLTYGQKVPDDIELFTTENYTKKLWEAFSI